ncbi:MAG TPA: hypothetical protein VK858_12690 [Longimicrobiales bacterium]|nr:hypothetical protein [Longimicrobiales bacterium]
MSTSEVHDGESGFQVLEASIDRALGRIRELEVELHRTRTRRDEVEGLLQRMSEGDENPARMAQRLKLLDQENGDLKRRIEAGREIAQRLLARVRYLEDHGQTQ